MKQLAITLGALLLSGSAWADTHQTGKITKLVVESTFVSVWLEGQPTNNECASDGRWTIDLASDNPAGKNTRPSCRRRHRGHRLASMP